MAHLLIDCPVQTVAPGEVVAGEILWDLPDQPAEILISLGWWTEGKGGRDETVVDSIRYPNPGRIGSERFRLQVPDGPLSFTGNLISLHWAIEARAVKRKEKAIHRLTVVADGHTIDISGRSHQSQMKAFGFRPQ